MIVGWTYLGIGAQVIVYRCIPESIGLGQGYLISRYKLIGLLGLRAQIEGVKGMMYN